MQKKANQLFDKMVLPCLFMLSNINFMFLDRTLRKFCFFVL